MFTPCAYARACVCEISWNLTFHVHGFKAAYCALAALLARTIPSFREPLQNMGAFETVQAAVQV